LGSLPNQLSIDLRDRLGLRRAVETGTYYGHTTAVLARMFADVVTVERSDAFYERARAILEPLGNVRQVKGHSGDALRSLDSAPGGTLYWLDAHWSGGDTAGSDDPCPLIGELDAIGAGDPNDVLLIDDAREFSAPPDHRWPTLVEVVDAVRRNRPSHYVTVVHDMVIAVPETARDIVDAFGREHVWTVWEAGEKARGVKIPGKLMQRLAPLLRLLVPLRRRLGRMLGRG
jgi:hypothetical protein